MVAPLDDWPNKASPYDHENLFTRANRGLPVNRFLSDNLPPLRFQVSCAAPSGSFEPFDVHAPINGWHIHIYYFNINSYSRALDLRAGLARTEATLRLGRVCTEAVGPHPQPQFQLETPSYPTAACNHRTLHRLAGLLLAHDFPVLIHPHCRPTGFRALDEKAELIAHMHPMYATWLNVKLQLNTAALA